ncbi:MAG: hypothetical protein LLF92_09845 [Planctomycetaceae bacterium]|nr:hypothetical protein [Planctomycetaceae bacterium]
MSASQKQSTISIIVIILLFCIAIAVGFKQQCYLTEDTALENTLFGDKFIPTDDVENYTSSNLYEKIDGKADLYLNNGFISLQCRRFGDSSALDKWMEVYLYEMGNSDNAFAVYSMQKRADGTALDWTQLGYSTSDAIYAAAGQYYIETVISVNDAELFKAALNGVTMLAKSISSGKEEIPGKNFFPTENLVADSFKFISADAFGSDLQNIFAAEYKIGENTITAYLCKDPTGGIYKNYHQFLIDNGGTELKTDSQLPNVKAVELFGTTDIIFKAGVYFAGVRGTAPLNDLKQTAEKLFEGLSKQK